MTPFHLGSFIQQIHCSIWDTSQAIITILKLQKALDFIYKSIDDNLTSNVSAINLLNEDKLEKRNYFSEN